MQMVSYAFIVSIVIVTMFHLQLQSESEHDNQAIYQANKSSTHLNLQIISDDGNEFRRINYSGYNRVNYNTINLDTVENDVSMHSEEEKMSEPMAEPMSEPCQHISSEDYESQSTSSDEKDDEKSDDNISDLDKLKEEIEEIRQQYGNDDPRVIAYEAILRQPPLFSSARIPQLKNVRWGRGDAPYVNWLWTLLDVAVHSGFYDISYATSDLYISIFKELEKEDWWPTWFSVPNNTKQLLAIQKYKPTVPIRMLYCCYIQYSIVLFL